MIELVISFKYLKLYDNIIIVFTSDNGLAIGSHWVLGKQFFLYDICPTFADLCQLRKPKNIDGENFYFFIKRGK
ncbi:hypothetical protein ALGA_0431 [Labilibaculum antarcticum]|uniref:Sulfatase N-terminal domain-containing protein n=1 Tax=Labilibaculum antarcticum TaxID=1717717 RepID=A0A1Y1CES4_9BACT|nr:hypothetical protein ALGA_0431 [Labilibaculum antarcticum]